MSVEDSRVYMQFAKSVIENKDIILKTTGMSYGNYCSSKDVVNAIFILLQNGVNGETYNIVNEKNTMQIYQMAELVANKVANGKIQVKIELEDLEKTGYAPNTELKLSGKKMMELSWKPRKKLEEMYQDIIEHIKKIRTCHSFD